MQCNDLRRLAGPSIVPTGTCACSVLQGLRGTGRRRLRLRTLRPVCNVGCMALMGDVGPIAGTVSLRAGARPARSERTT